MQVVEVNFDSGWEWGSWMQDVITARAVWNPHMEIAEQTDALAQALSPITNIFGQYSQNISAILLRFIASQHALLIQGLVDGAPPGNIVKFNGQAYMEGWDTWSEIAAATNASASTQPTKISFLDVQDPLHYKTYLSEVAPLLAEMETEFSEIANLLLAYQPLVPTWTLDLYNDIVESTQVLAFRAVQVHALYDYATGFFANKTWRAERLKDAQNAMMEVQTVISNREANYRISPYVVAGWRPNPTCYSYGYLWTVHSMFYFWRDYQQAIDSSLEAALSPCFMNIIDPANVAFGEGIFYNVTAVAYEYFQKFGFTKFFSDCLAAPAEEPKYGPI